MRDFSFVSTGDPEKDAKIAASFVKSDRLRAEGMCPNGHGPMIEDSPNEWHCPKCHFVYCKTTLKVG